MKKKILTCFMIFILLLVGCEMKSDKQVANGQGIEVLDDYTVEVRGLTLKYILIDSAYEIYQFQTELKDQAFVYFNDVEARPHYEWMMATYEAMDDEMKEALEMIVTKVHPWKLLNLTTSLRDDATLEEIIECIISNKKLPYSKEEKEQIINFFTGYYEDYLKYYLEVNEPIFEAKAAQLNEEVKMYSDDIVEFMEEKSGISFAEKRKPVFYYTFRKIGAMGFTLPNVKISFIQRGANMDTLFNTPFHEFGHELFQTFTDKKEFKKVADVLADKDSRFKKEWEEKQIQNYDWIGWCEENLVEGFASYLSDLYYREEIMNTCYIYDYQFYKYLKEIEFNPNQISLEEVSIQFYKKILAELE